MKADDDSVKVASQSHQPISLQVNNGLTSMRRVSTRAQARLEEKSEMAQGEAVHDIVDVGAPSVSNRREHARHTLKIPLVGNVGALSSDQLRSAQDNDEILQAVKKLIESPETDNTAFVNLGAEYHCYMQQLSSLKIIDGLVYRGFVDPNGTVQYWQLILPCSARAAFLELIHAQSLCHAKDFNRNAKQLQMHAYWYNWKQSLRIFLASCRRCLEFHSGKLPGDRHSDWSQYLDSSIFHNGTLCKATGFTPKFFTVWARELPNSTTLFLDNPVSTAESYGEFASELIERLTVAQQLARELCSKVQCKRNATMTRERSLSSIMLVTQCWFIIHVEDSASMQNGCVFFLLRLLWRKK
jgi:hypothetical protein